MEESRSDYVCRCEEVTREEIEEAIKNGAVTMNEVKRWTRAGMGLCQGKTCFKNAARILSEMTGRSAAEVIPSNVRQPVRPVRTEVIANAKIEEGT